MAIGKGDRLTVEAEKVGQTARAGVVEEVLGEDPLRVQVRWDDGHTSVLAPAAGAMRVEPARRSRRAPAKRRS